MTEMTQRAAVRRAWAAAERAEQRAAGTPERADVWATVAQAWAAVASQLPFAEDGGELLDARTLVPVPRPLERREPTNTQTAAELAAADAALRDEPVDDPRATVVMNTVATPARWPAGLGPATGMTTKCRCGVDITWYGGAWVHTDGGELRCVAR